MLVKFLGRPKHVPKGMTCEKCIKSFIEENKGVLSRFESFTVDGKFITFIKNEPVELDDYSANKLLDIRDTDLDGKTVKIFGKA